MTAPPWLRSVRRPARVGTEAPWLHQEIARRMAERLAFIRQQPEAVLDWWSDRSGSHAALRQQYPQARLLRSGPDGALQAEAAPWWQRWRPTRPVATEPVPLVWANLVLPWADDPEPWLERWRDRIAPEGFLMFSCYGPDTLRELRPLYSRLGWGPPARDFIDMHDLGDALVRCGFADPVMDMETLTLTWATPDALVNELSTLGRNLHPDRHTGLRGRGWSSALRQALEAQRGSDGRIALTVEVVFGHAFRPTPRPKVTAQTTVSLEAMREMTRRAAPPRD